MTTQQPVAIAVGTHTWRQDDIPRLEKLIALLQKNDIVALDTARLYVRAYKTFHSYFC